MERSDRFPILSGNRKLSGKEDFISIKRKQRYFSILVAMLLLVLVQFLKKEI
jgi:hypothetical protein